MRLQGLPHKDHKWPAIAVGSGADTIISEDIDLFDPAAKNKDAKTKATIKKNGGALSKYLKKNHNIVVTTSSDFIESF